MPMTWCMCGDQKATLGVLLLLCGFQGSNSACQVCVPAGEGGCQGAGREKEGGNGMKEERRDGMRKARLGSY